MSTTKGIATLLLCIGAGAVLGAAPQALQTQASTNQSNQLPVEVQLLDHNLVPVLGATVSINGDPIASSGAGRYAYAVATPKAYVNINLHERGVEPVDLEIPLQKSGRVKFVYLEICLDPGTGEVKAILQKPVRGGSVGAGPIYTQPDPDLRSPNGGPVTVTGPPANDDCDNAATITEGVTPFSTIGATTDGPDHPSCQFGNGETVNDIWYVYTATADGTLTVSTCDNADYDTDLVIYDGTDCNALLANFLDCNDDASGCSGFTSELEVMVTSGNDYLVRVGGYGAFGSDDEGTGNLTLTLDAGGGAPANDDCADAEDIACNSTATFDNTFATVEPGDPAFSCKFGGPDQGAGTVWYTFTATETSAFLNTNMSAGGDTLLAVYDGTCGSFTELACSEDEGDGLLSELTVMGLVVGNTYYVQVASFDDSSLGTYTLELLCPAPGDPTGRCCLPDGTCFDGVTEDDCFMNLGGNDWLEGATCTSDPCPQPVPNDDCADAIDLGSSLPVAVVFDNSGATDDIASGSECGVFSGPFQNVWYSFTSPADQLTRVTTCRPNTTHPDTKISVFCGDCGDLVCVGGNDDACSVGSNPFLSTVDFCAEAGRTYLITVGDFSASTGGGQIALAIGTQGTPCVPSIQCDPVGACCLPDDTCAELTEADCLAMGGEYQGDDTTCASNAVGDPGFENGPFGGVWNEFSSTFGTPICDVGTCGTGGGTPPFEGTFWCWFGGISGVTETGFVEQTVTIPSGADTLEFYLDIPASSGNGVDFMDVSIDGTVVFSVLEGDPTYTVPGWQLVSVDISGFDDSGAHDLRFDSTTTGTGVTNFFIDSISIMGGDICETCVVLDFQTEDDFTTPLVNGQDISTPPEFGNLVSISASTISEGPAIYDTDPLGPNLAGNNDPDLLVDKGNVLMFQEVPGQTVPGIFDDPDDSSAGGTFFFDFTQPVELRSVVLVDIDLYPLPQDAFVTLIDGNSNTRDYHAPSGWTEDVVIDGGTGYRTLDLTTLAPQPGFTATATATEDPGFDPEDVVRMEISLTSSGAVDDIEFCF